eukprot:CAMPEP_0202838358 /NCGR_PEP_ID=MMETSP1389-20130828/49131_1 /ASSEMBLY_ACC=CAM_ASM_000865 /TAXON_ID=302021 /ORGANISM="Rhodomonas sp., Strain CCMP768" /LENGTH=64 /DNA_ID=CAMNT_0049514623 /DNA_START=19 /DNA_END=213 /DNA_ORIENTATION=-
MFAVLVEANSHFGAAYEASVFPDSASKELQSSTAMYVQPPKAKKKVVKPNCNGVHAAACAGTDI